jgi:5'-nucleotidase
MQTPYGQITDLSQARILVTNDDGIHAPGLKVLERIARTLSRDVWVVAPETEQSGAGHSLTLHSPLRMRAISSKRYAVSGTPTDCVLLAIRALFTGKKRRPDLILSGVNRGVNVAEDITYSGTVAAAMEGTLLNIPSFALSQSIDNILLNHEGEVEWKTAERHAPDVIRAVTAKGWQPNTLINLNFPSVKPEAVKGVKVAWQGRRQWGEKLETRHDPRGKAYYWIGGERDRTAFTPGTDIAHVTEGYVTVTPISLDLTEYDLLENLKQTLEKPVHLAYKEIKG